MQKGRNTGYFRVNSRQYYLHLNVAYFVGTLFDMLIRVEIWQKPGWPKYIRIGLFRYREGIEIFFFSLHNYAGTRITIIFSEMDKIILLLPVVRPSYCQIWVLEKKKKIFISTFLKIKKNTIFLKGIS